MKNIYFTLVIVFISVHLISAQFDLKGSVKDSKSFETLPNAIVFIPALNKGTASDVNGKYILKNIPAGTYKIKYSYLSYSEIIKEVSGDSAMVNIDIELDPEAPFCLHQVVITGGTYSTQDESAIKIETIDKSDIEGFSGVSLIKDISRIPGIDAVSKGNGIATPIIRGLSTNNILVLNNGVKMQNFQFSVNHPYLIDEFGVEKIEVIKGPASILFGSNAVGGALNMIKESPALKNKIKSDINFSYNNNTKGFVSNIGTKVTPGDYFFGLRAGIKSHQDYIDGKGDIVPNSRFNEKSAKFFTGFSKDFFVSKLFIDYNAMELGLTVPPSIELFKDNNDNNLRESEFWYQDLSNLLISSKNIVFSGNFRNEINLNFQTNNRKLYEDPNDIEFNAVDMILNTFTYEAKTTKSFINNNFVFSIQGLNQNNKNYDAPERVLPDFKLNDIAAMALFQLNSNKKIHSQFGIRYDIRNILINKQENINDEIKKSYNNISYSAGLTYNVNNHLLIRTNFASGYRTPSIAELSQDGGHGARYELGNTSLVPQRNYETDVSIHIHSHKIKYELSGFYNNINSYIYLSPTLDTAFNGLPIFKYLQTNAKLYGFETNLGYFPYNWLNFSISYNYLIGQKDNGDNLPLIPQNKIHTNISLMKSFKYKSLETFSAELESVYAFDQDNYHAAETFTPNFMIHNLSLSQSMKLKNNNFKFYIKVNNIFDNNYIDHISTLKGLGYNDIGRNTNIGFKIILNKDIK